MDDHNKYINSILEMDKADQDARKLFASGPNNPERYNEIVVPVDKKNENMILEIMDVVGWPVISKFGEVASNSFWRLVQHAKIEIKRRALELMEKNKEDIDKKNYAMLKDRVLLIDKKPQIYGTQLGLNPETNKPELLPVENMDKVDDLRASVGLGPLSEYLLSFDK